MCSRRLCQCQQQVYHWRRGFQKAVSLELKKTIASRRANTKLDPADRSDDGIQAWIQLALCPGGEAMFGRPDVANVSRRHARTESVAWNSSDAS